MTEAGARKRRRNGLLGRLAGAFTHNWGLKLLALALALIIYYSISNNTVSVNAGLPHIEAQAGRPENPQPQ